MKDVLLLLSITFLLGIWYIFFPDQYFLVSILLILLVLIYGMFHLEKLRLNAKELAMMASLATIAVAGRILFFAFPQVKPTAAIVFISGLALGKAPGFTIGLLSMFLSNFIFGQSVNTPFQMLGMGLVGFSGGFLVVEETKKMRRTWQVASLGGLVTLLLYGFVVDTGSALYFLQFQQVSAVYAVYLAGIPFNLVHAVSTTMFLYFFYGLMGRQINRVKEKYGLFDSKMVK